MLKIVQKRAKKCPKKLWKKCLKMIKKENSEFGIRNSALFDDSEFGIRSSEIFLKIRNSEFGNLKTFRSPFLVYTTSRKNKKRIEKNRKGNFITF